jgi:dienelactone hydrolase
MYGARNGDPANNRRPDIAARELVSGSAGAEMFLYPGDQHLFSEGSLPSYDPEAAALMAQRVIEFLGQR